MLSGCFRIMKMIVTTRMAAIICTVFITMFGSREVRIQIPTIRKPVNRHQRLLIYIFFRYEENVRTNHKQAKQNLKAQQTKQQLTKTLTITYMAFPLYTPTHPICGLLFKSEIYSVDLQLFWPLQELIKITSRR